MPKISFNNKNAQFYPGVKKAVEEYFTQTGKSKTGNIALYTKSFVLLPAAALCYILIVFFHLPVWAIGALSAVMGLVMASIGFNVMHDANHGAYSKRSWVNTLFGLSLNALGGNAFIWKQKHNIIHHSYTNVDGVDDDIAKNPYIRMCSSQPWFPAHKFQHIYLSFLYALSSIIWIYFQDFEKYFRQKINTTEMNTMSAGEHLIFWISKVVNIGLFIVLPVMVMGWQHWLLFFATLHIFLGFTLAIVFQLAHVVEETDFVYAPEDSALKVENEWAIHQVKTTSDFAPDNRLLSWYVGGLNFQVEHHLFPRISHVHYPAIRKIVMEKCREFGVNYHCMPTMAKAVVSHYRFIYTLGQKA